MNRKYTIEDRFFDVGGRVFAIQKQLSEIYVFDAVTGVKVGTAVKCPENELIYFVRFSAMLDGDYMVHCYHTAEEGPARMSVMHIMYERTANNGITLREVEVGKVLPFDVGYMSNGQIVSYKRRTGQALTEQESREYPMHSATSFFQ